MALVRSDSWAGNLTEEQCWKLYEASRTHSWTETVAWACEEFKLPEAPSRSAFYRWQRQMREDYAAHRMEEAAIASAEAAAMARNVTKDEALIDAFKAMGTDLALRTGSADEAQKFVNMATALTDRLHHAKELAIKAEAQKVKEGELAVAQKKLALEEAKSAAAKTTLANEKLTAAEREAKLREIFGL